MPQFVGSNATWSPDGKLIAYTDASSKFRNSRDLVIQSNATGEEKVYSHDGFIAGYRIVWFHDGKSLLAIGQPTPQQAQRLIYRIIEVWQQ